jgi:hypothetical protein
VCTYHLLASRSQQESADSESVLYFWSSSFVNRYPCPEYVTLADGLKQQEMSAVTKSHLRRTTDGAPDVINGAKWQ